MQALHSQPISSIKSDGPDLPPLTKGLRFTSDEAIRDLMGMVLACGLIDEEKMLWVRTPDYLLVCALAGLEIHTADRIKRAVLEGRGNSERIRGAFCHDPT